MAENKQNTTPERRPDCVTEIRMGNTVLVVSGFFKKWLSLLVSQGQDLKIGQLS